MPFSPTSIAARLAGAPSHSRFRRIRCSLGAWAATLAALAVLAVAAPSAAQATTLVSNAGTTGTGTGSLADFDLSQQFTTGSNPEGYTLESVVLDFAGAPSGVTVKVGTGSAHNLTDAVTLTNPSSLAAGDNTFTAPAGTTLSASTTYVVVIEGSSGGVRFSTGTGEDAGAAPGWGIANTSGFRSAASTSAFTSNTDVVTISVKGTAVVPAISISGGAAVTEGTAAQFTVTASSARSADITVKLTVSEAAGSDFVAATDEGSQSVTIAASATQATYSVTTQADTADEPDGAVTVALASGTGYSVRPPNSASVTVRDDDEPLTVTVTGGPPVTEGRAALFTVRVNRTPSADLAVNVTVSDAEGSDFVAAADEGAKTVTIAAGTNATLYRVTTHDDDEDEPSGPVTVAVASGTGYVVGTRRNSYGVMVADDDEPLVVSITGGVAVTEGTAAQFTVTMSRARLVDVTVNLSVYESFGSDFVAVADEGPDTVTIASGETSASYQVTTQADVADEPNGPVTVALAAGTGYSVGTARSASVTVNDDDMPVPAVPPVRTAGTLVSNLGQTDAGTGFDLAGSTGGHYAQSFTTGNIGATLSGVTVDFSAAASGVTVTLRTGVSASSIGTTVDTLTNPESLAAGDLTFTASANIRLSASTTYWVVIAGTTGRVQGTPSDSEDLGAATGWTIADGSRQKWPSDFAFSRTSGSALSIRVEGVPHTAPSAPSAPGLSTGSTTSLKAAWRAPTNDGGAAVTDYDVRWRELYATTWTELDDTTASTATRATIAGLAPGKTYEVQVRAQNAAGHGAWSPGARGATAAYGEVSLTLSGTQCATCPAVPTATARPGPGVGEITVEWEPGSEAGRPAVTAWRVRWNIPGEASSGTSYGASNRSHTFTALTPGATYEVHIRASGAGEGQLTSVTGTVRAGTGTTVENPTAPTIKQVGLVSSPTHDANRDSVYDTFVRGDRIVIDATFAEAMRVDAGGSNANVALRVDIGGTVKRFPLERVLNAGQTLRFAYAVRRDTACRNPPEVQPPGTVCDLDTDGFALAPGTVGGVARTLVELSGGARVASAASGVDADLRLPQGQPLVAGAIPAPADAARLKVDGSKGSWNVGPRATGAQIPADSEGGTLTVSFDKALGAIGGFAAADRQQSFGIRATNLHLKSTQRQHPTGVSLSADGRTLTLTLGKPVRAADQVEVEYLGAVQKWSNPRETIRVLRGTDGWQVAGFSGLLATNHLPGAPPIPLHAGMAGTSLTIVFDKALNETATPAGSAFRVDARNWEGRSGRTLRGTGTAAVAGDTVTVTLNGALNLPAGEIADVHYAPPASNPLTGAGATGALVNPIENFDVTATPDVTAPVLQTSLANIYKQRVVEGGVEQDPGKSKIHLYYDEALDRTSVPAPGAFTFSSTHASAPAGAAVELVEIEKNVVSLTTTHWLRDNVTYTLVYTPGADPVRDLAGNAAAAITSGTFTSFSTGQPVPRHVDGDLPGSSRTTMVSNIGQPTAGSSNNLSHHVLAQQFTTGSGTTPLARVIVDFATVPSGVTVRVGTGTAADVAGKSGTGCDDLAADGCVTLTTSGYTRFNAPSGTTLSATTSYWVVIQGSGGTIRQANNNKEDEGNATDWSIADTHSSRRIGDFRPGANEMKIRVERVLKEPAAAGFTVNGRRVKLNMKQPLDPGSVPAPSAFTLWETEILPDETAYRELDHHRIESVTVNGSTATLHLNNPILPCAGLHPFRVSYTAPAANPLQATDGWDAPSWGADHGVNPVRNAHPHPCVRFQ